MRSWSFAGLSNLDFLWRWKSRGTELRAGFLLFFPEASCIMQYMNCPALYCVCVYSESSAGVYLKLSCWQCARQSYILWESCLWAEF